ncbi:unnamed protein product [Chondrus crispus]|uniref:Uncharacterized protein n=1 Tax=Chondrus crispus TaxID=2769 RepID=R7QLI9_CHOCR|nr:unnamed protein product [Chondrus crispus]CDF38949.1 unnamed protein product [Chondrus crispus]|eukprot:XP_005718854.1 unnamed protein product [Chondrus crispus]
MIGPRQRASPPCRYRGSSGAGPHAKKRPKEPRQGAPAANQTGVHVYAHRLPILPSRRRGRRF